MSKSTAKILDTHALGDLMDYSRNHHLFTATDCEIVRGKFGKGVNFNGTSSYIDCGNAENLNPLDAITIMAWVKLSTATPAGYGGFVAGKVHALWKYGYALVEYNNGYTAMLGSGVDDTPSVCHSGGNYVGKLVHVAFTFDSTTQKIYINGKLKNSVAGTLYSTTNPLLIGKNNIDSKFFEGIISEVKIYNRALSASEIANQYTMRGYYEEVEKAPISLISVLCDEIVHATKADFDAGIGNGAEVQKRGISLRRVNWLKNSSFERAGTISGLADKWGIYNPSGADYTVLLDAGAFTSGSKSQKVTYTSNSVQAIDLGQTLLDAVGNENYTVSVDVKIDDATKVEAKIVIELWGNGTYIAGYASATTESLIFTRLSRSITTTSDTDEIRVWIELVPKFAGAEGTIWIDSAQLEKHNYASAFTLGYATTDGEYVSPPIDMTRDTIPYKLTWTSSIPSTGTIKGQLRSARTLEALGSAIWYGPTGVGDYYERSGSEDEWAINAIHDGSRWLQYKIDLETTDIEESASIHDVAIKYGASVPEIHWINVLDDSSNQKYAYGVGETANFKAEVVDFKGVANIVHVDISICQPDGRVVLKDCMALGANISAVKRYYEYSYSFATNATLGLWKAIITITNQDGKTYSETSFLKIKEPYISPPQKMTIGAAIYNGGFSGDADANIAEYIKYPGLEIWKLVIIWNRFEPGHDNLDEDYITGIVEFMDGAHENGAKVQIGIGQSLWPVWANNGDDDSTDRYDYKPTTHLADTWMQLADRIKNHPAFYSYLIINEENHDYDADVYLRALNKVASSIRTVDGNLNHRITIRPNKKDSYLRTRIAQDGIQDYDYGTGAYPTSWAWYLSEYESPISETSYLRMSRLRASPIVYGYPGGIGEIGFMKAVGDTFGDDEKLSGFERAMSIAYDQGMNEFMIWGSATSFADPETYFPMLEAFRDNLILNSRPDHFNIRVVIDNAEWLYTSEGPTSKLDMAFQDYKHLVKTLDEAGYSWFYTHTNAIPLQTITYDASISFSEVRDISEAEQDALFATRFAGVTPNGTVYLWP